MLCMFYPSHDHSVGFNEEKGDSIMKVIFTEKQKVGTADKMIYGHFLEHFHRQVYGGVYDPTSKFADKDGFRTDVIEAQKMIKTPIIR